VRKHTLRQLLHPRLHWATLRGEVPGYEDYSTGNVRSDLVWRAQRPAEARVAATAGTAVLTTWSRTR